MTSIRATKTTIPNALSAMSPPLAEVVVNSTGTTYCDPCELLDELEVTVICPIM